MRRNKINITMKTGKRKSKSMNFKNGKKQCAEHKRRKKILDKKNIKIRKDINIMKKRARKNKDI